MTTTKDGISHTRTRIQQFNATKQLEFFESLKLAKFSGQLAIHDVQDTSWTLYLYLGRIVYATGGIHPVRRWRRNLVAYCPQRLAHFNEIQLELATIPEEECRISWEYKLLSLWIDQKKITREQATRMIKATIIEVLFDLAHPIEVFCQTIKDNLISTRLVLIEAEQVIAEANKLWQAWQEAKIADRSPDMAPVIRQPEALKKRTSSQVYQNLSQLLDGQQTLRDLSIRMRRDVVTVTRSLIPYIQLGLVQLITIDDIPPPVSPPIAHKLSKGISPHRILIACIDDSPQICQSMEHIMRSAGYQFVSEMDGLRAIAVLLNRKPDLIFLDLIMPNTNGYEICTQLRKLSYFKQTPIVIVTGNDGLIDRVRAKMVGSTDFISKPVDEKLVLGTIEKYLSKKV
ncbi:response regulator containing a CheY-like receiver domain and a GGDEF domain [Xenococcus sp. PCC 7305]|uniref:response regulator n=1 Tax=Xenococcus sp. PCC 7305 TaxID=102125 RepID=UPI0002AC961A|nr:response regulator [Xenococcus sp. PCC 7305]ELS01047.1 response regulator containing a CheY-like receiver domain and a GGDEF domain [Xenococcus sp. PCC 7305]